MREIFGVIGAAGVAATNKLATLIEEELTRRGAFRDCHHPEMIIWQLTQAPSRSLYLEGRGPSFLEDYTKAGLLMKQCGATRLCMCCNTAHWFINQLEQEIGLPFINVVKETEKKAIRLGGKRLGIMCGDGARQVDLYSRWLPEIADDVSLIYPDNVFQKMVTEGICNAKNKLRFSAPDNEHHPAHLFSLVEKHLRSKGADIVIGGCTDILNVYHGGNSCNYVDSLETLAEVIVELYIKSQPNGIITQ